MKNNTLSPNTEFELQIVSTIMPILTTDFTKMMSYCHSTNLTDLINFCKVLLAEVGIVFLFEDKPDNSLDIHIQIDNKVVKSAYHLSTYTEEKGLEILYKKLPKKFSIYQLLTTKKPNKPKAKSNKGFG